MVFYVSLHGIYVNPLELSVKASKLIHHVADIDPVYATRIAIAYHKVTLETNLPICVLGFFWKPWKLLGSCFWLYDYYDFYFSSMVLS